MARYETDGYRLELDALSMLALDEVNALLAIHDEFTDVPAFREYLANRIESLLDSYTQAASVVAADHYGIWRDEILPGAKPHEAVLATGKSGGVQSNVYALTDWFRQADIGVLDQDTALAMSTRALCGMVDERIMDASRKTMIENAARDKMSRGCASVPGGVTTCPFCLSMASVGVSKSFKAMAERGRIFHANCNCIFVPGFIGQTIEIPGYDPEAISNSLSDAMKTVGIPEGRAFSSLSDAEQYRVRQELERRDPAWVMEGVVPEYVDDKPWSRLTDREKDSVVRLSQSGFRVVIRREDPRAPANIDFLINGQLWEEKSSKGTFRTSVFESLADAVNKWIKLELDQPRRVVYSNLYGTRDDEIVKKEIREMMNELEISEVLFIAKGGDLIWLEK